MSAARPAQISQHGGMHDELARVAWKRGRRWVLFASFLVGIGGAVALALVGGPAGAVIGLLIGWPVGHHLLVRQGQGKGGAPRGAVTPGDQRQTNLADGIALATGTMPAAVFQVESPAPNVGALPVKGGYAVYFTSGATTSLQRDELEALCAAQIAGLIDPHPRKLHAAADRLRAGRLISCFSAVFLVPGFFIAPIVGGMVLAVDLPWTLACWALAERIRFWARAGVDAASVATTRHPQALVDALPRLAAWNGPKVKVQIPWGAIGAVDRFWMVPVSVGWTTTTEVNGRTTSTRSAELDEDIALLVRSSLVRQVCLQSRDADVTTYKEIKGYLKAAGKNAARGKSTLVEGVQVGLGGVVDPTAPEAPKPAAFTLAQADASLVDLHNVILGMVGQKQARSNGVPAIPGVAPGWYPDPQVETGWRWWDGREWTSHASAPAAPGPGPGGGPPTILG